MAGHVCPSWLGYVLLFPLRKWIENPDKILGPFVREGMRVLEPGCAMGFFTLPLARMVGPAGRVVALDTQPKMLDSLRRRAKKAGFLDRIEIRTCDDRGLNIQELAGSMDLAVAIHMVHEVPEQARLFAQIHEALRPGARFLMIEPKHHVSSKEFAESLAAALDTGFRETESPVRLRGLNAVLSKA